MTQERRRTFGVAFIVGAPTALAILEMFHPHPIRALRSRHLSILPLPRISREKTQGDGARMDRHTQYRRARPVCAFALATFSEAVI